MTLRCSLMLCVIWCSTAATGQTPPNLRELGQSEYQAGHYREAESYLRAALEQAAVDEDTRAVILSDLGTLLLDEERSVEAEEAYTKALAILQKRRADKRVTASLLRHLGAVYSIQRRDEEAISILNKALKMAKAPPANPELIGAILNSLGVAYFRQSRLKKAEQFFNQGLQTLVNAGTRFEVYTAPLLNNLGAVYCERRNFPLAEQFLTKALTLANAQFGPTHAALTDSLDGLGVVYTKMGRYADAEAQYQRAIAILGQHSPIPFDVRVARSHKGLADTYMQQGKLDEAVKAMEEAVRIARPNLTKSPEMISILEAYSGLLVVTGKAREAKELRSEAQRARITIASTVRAYKRD